MRLDRIDRKLLNLVQAEFPLTREPYTDLGLRLGIDGDEVIHRIEQLKAVGVIRQISPVIDAQRLGFQTTLVAMKIAKSQLAEAERLIGEHPLVSHGYERNHAFNVWFTLAVPPTTAIEIELNQLTKSLEAEAAFALSAIKVFKIGAYFDMDGNGQAAIVVQASGSLTQPAKLSPADKLVINELQQDLPPGATPFAGMAARVSMDETDFLTRCQSLKERGIMRRYAAAINHRQAGFKANAMTCWAVPPDKVDAIGSKLASLPEVSHCYQRKTNPLWRYNLFAMIHGHTREACQEIASKVSGETGLIDYVLLFSTKEFKKVRNRYLV